MLERTSEPSRTIQRCELSKKRVETALFATLVVTARDSRSAICRAAVGTVFAASRGAKSQICTFGFLGGWETRAFGDGRHVDGGRSLQRIGAGLDSICSGFHAEFGGHGTMTYKNEEWDILGYILCFNTIMAATAKDNGNLRCPYLHP
uniref:Uncharacterized protein n=1 Tax=Steinernema glaseri TaxID=37863 RepID=A0A1I7Y511_9BILA